MTTSKLQVMAKPSEEQTYRQGVLDKLGDIQDSVDAVDKKVSYTNGKVRKITVALIFMGGILIGQTFTNFHDLISVAAGFLH